MTKKRWCKVGLVFDIVSFETALKKCQSLPVDHFNTPLVTNSLTTCNLHFTKNNEP